jgi:hypothetical protein
MKEFSHYSYPQGPYMYVDYKLSWYSDLVKKKAILHIYSEIFLENEHKNVATLKVC